MRRLAVVVALLALPVVGFLIGFAIGSEKARSSAADASEPAPDVGTTDSEAGETPSFAFNVSTSAELFELLNKTVDEFDRWCRGWGGSNISGTDPPFVCDLGSSGRVSAHAESRDFYIQAMEFEGVVTARGVLGVVGFYDSYAYDYYWNRNVFGDDWFGNSRLGWTGFTNDGRSRRGGATIELNPLRPGVHEWDHTTGKPTKVVKESTVNFIVMTRKEAERRERARRDGYRKKYPDGDGVVRPGATYNGDPLDEPDAGGLPY